MTIRGVLTGALGVAAVLSTVGCAGRQQQATEERRYEERAAAQQQRQAEEQAPVYVYMERQYPVMPQGEQTGTSELQQGEGEQQFGQDQQLYGEREQGLEQGQQTFGSEEQGSTEPSGEGVQVTLNPMGRDDVRGTIQFTQHGDVVLVSADIRGLPQGEHTLELLQSASCPRRQAEAGSMSGMEQQQSGSTAGEMHSGDEGIPSEHQAGREQQAGEGSTGMGTERDDRRGAAAGGRAASAGENTIGTLRADRSGHAQRDWTSWSLQISGPEGIAGRGVVIRTRQAGGAQAETGSAEDGRILACGVAAQSGAGGAPSAQPQPRY